MDYFSNKLIQALLPEIVLPNLDKIGQELIATVMDKIM